MTWFSPKQTDYTRARFHEKLWDIVKERDAEIERLRASLQDIAEDPYAVDSGAAEIARAALEPKP